MQKITPMLWFSNQAEEAVKFYTSLFPNSKITSMTRYDKQGAKASGQKEGSVMVISFELLGQEFTALNGGPVFQFSEAISFVVNCENQKEVDHYWNKLSAVSQAEQCGWLKDKFGVSWQIVPKQLGELLGGNDPAGSARAMKAMLAMKKIDIASLQKAYGGK
jgi:predicted 3-demethylubiquinone-9 3-methyltransferase (glyoxalase superfamily)